MISGQLSGALVMQIVSVVMVGCALGVTYILSLAYVSLTLEDYFLPFLVLFLVLLAATGIGNGSTFSGLLPSSSNQVQAGPVLGWRSAVAAYGAFIIPKVFGEQIKATTPENALYWQATPVSRVSGSPPRTRRWSSSRRPTSPWTVRGTTVPADRLPIETASRASRTPGAAAPDPVTNNIS